MKTVRIAEKKFVNKETAEVVKYKRMLITGEINGEEQEIEIKLNKSQIMLAEILLQSENARVFPRVDIDQNEVIAIAGLMDGVEYYLDIIVEPEEYTLAKILLKSNTSKVEKHALNTDENADEFGGLDD